MIKQISPSNRASRKGSVLNLVLVGLLTVILLGAGTWMFFGGSGVSELDEPLTAKAFAGLFVKEVLDQGEIQSSDNVEIRSNVKSRYGSRGVTVKWVIEEGARVKAGDKLVELRSDEIKENYDKQIITVNNAKDAYTAASNNLKSAEAALKEYTEGVFQEALITVNNEISEAEQLLEEAEEYYKYSLRLQAKNFIQAVELRSDEARVDRAKESLRLAKKKKAVLETHSQVKNVTELQAAIDIAKGKVAAAESNKRIEETTLAEVQEQLDACTIRCPEGKQGQVVYANIFSRRGNSEFILEEGATVREGQVLIRLPNRSKMQVKAKVNESRVTSIKVGMPVTISVDALNGEELEGIVQKVNPYAEPEGWGGGGVRKYAVFVDIINPTERIRPGMNSSVQIETDRIENALLVPIQAVYGYRGKTFCLVHNGDQWDTVEVSVGANNDTNIVIESGLQEGAEVALNPAAFKSMLQLPDLPELEEDSSKDKSSKSGKGRKQSKREGKNRKSGDKPESNQSTSKMTKETKAVGDSNEKTTDRKNDLRTKNQKSGSSRESGPNSETAPRP